MPEYDDMPVGYCPECGVGKITPSSKPYLKLYRGKLFTMPDAIVWQCDICGYYEFDDTVYELISDMIDLSCDDNGHYGMMRHFPATADDELSQKRESS